MMDMISLNKIEKSLKPRFRERLNHAESVEDVKKFFSYTTSNLVTESLDGNCKLETDDITLSLEKPNYNISDKMRSNEQFNAVWNFSDMPEIVARFALAAIHRHNHLAMNSLKSQLKIKGH